MNLVCATTLIKRETSSKFQKASYMLLQDVNCNVRCISNWRIRLFNRTRKYRSITSILYTSAEPLIQGQ